jgi:hypothetical protein
LAWKKENSRANSVKHAQFNNRSLETGLLSSILVYVVCAVARCGCFQGAADSARKG